MGHTGELGTEFAELLSDMYKQTLHAVNDLHVEPSVPATLPIPSRSRLIGILDRWHFEPYKLSEDELIACTLLLFELLFRIERMQDVVPVSMQQISAFVHHLRRIYRLENSYHNFEHALDVLQATYSYLREAGVVPPVGLLSFPNRMWKSKKVFDDGSLVTTLCPEEIFILFVAAIGHDVGHPGFSNHFMKTAESPLSKVYDGRSPLEHMHVQLLLRVMHQHDLGTIFNDQLKGAHLRKLLLTSVLATDMSVHSDFMDRLQRYLSRQQSTLCFRQTVLMQAILKCADISNPSRPYPVSQHWAGALMHEWAKQASYEKSLAFKPSVQESTSPLKEAKSQVFFIDHFAQPLLDLTTRAIPEMKKFLHESKKNRNLWMTRVQELEARLPTPEDDDAPEQGADDFINVFPLTLPHSRQAMELRDDSFLSPSNGSTDSGLTSPVASEASFSMLEEHAAIRAAGKLGVRQQKIINRNSWCATSVPISHFAPTQQSTSSPLAHVHESSNGSSPTYAA